MATVQIGSWQYNQIQINGQRITTNAAFKYHLYAERYPVEVFITRIPFTMYEDNLIPLFETVGVVAQFRLMMSYSGRNRGFGYIIFVDRNDAQRAIDNLNNILVSSWCRLQLCISKNMRCLWLDNVSEEVTVDGAINLMIEKVDPEEIYISRRNGSPCYVMRFPTHRDAALSRKLLLRDVSDFGPFARTNWDLRGDP